MNLKNRIPGHTVCILIALFITMPLISGCITTFNPKKTMIRTIDFFKPSYTKYNKKIAITRFENRTRFNASELITFVHQNLITVLDKNYPALMLQEATEDDFSDLGNRFPLLPTGEIDNLALAEKGRQFDLNAIIVGAITDIKGFEKKKGFWIFRRPVQYIEIHLMVTVYDTQTSGKLLEQWTFKKIKVNKDVLDKLNAEKPELPVKKVEKVLTVLTKKAGEEIGYLLNHQPFKTYIKSVSDDRITIGAGETSHIIPGTVFNMYNSSEIINGKDGQRFFVPGTITGKLKISDVFPETAVGVVEEGKAEGIGSCLIPKY